MSEAVRWDERYAKGDAPWETGRSSSELRRVVAEVPIRPCRALELGCGTGASAVWLAQQGFDVTALDLSTVAIACARQRADETGASVRFLVADVLNPPPELAGPFDFVFDRGCYHVVRDQNLAAYLETLRLFSHPGTWFLLLAARRENQAGVRPSQGVAEEELRYDFLPLFDLEWLREIRLESNQPGTAPPGWSALLRRKAEP